jgi:hypothetical protein
VFSKGMAGIVARLFQKYVTPEGRTEIPPDDEDNKVVLDGYTDGFKRDKTSSNAFKMSDVVGEGTLATEKGLQGMDMDTILPIYVLLHGLRNLIQSLKGFDGNLD